MKTIKSVIANCIPATLTHIPAEHITRINTEIYNSILMSNQAHMFLSTLQTKIPFALSAQDRIIYSNSYKDILAELVRQGLLMVFNNNDDTSNPVYLAAFNYPDSDDFVDDFNRIIKAFDDEIVGVIKNSKSPAISLLILNNQIDSGMKELAFEYTGAQNNAGLVMSRVISLKSFNFVSYEDSYPTKRTLVTKGDALFSPTNKDIKVSGLSDEEALDFFIRGMFTEEKPTWTFDAILNQAQNNLTFLTNDNNFNNQWIHKTLCALAEEGLVFPTALGWTIKPTGITNQISNMIEITKNQNPGISPVYEQVLLEIIASQYVELVMTKLDPIHSNRYQKLKRVKGFIADHGLEFRIAKTPEGQFGIPDKVSKAQLVQASYPISAELMVEVVDLFCAEGY